MKRLLFILIVVIINSFSVQAAGLLLFEDCREVFDGGVKIYLGYSTNENLIGSSEIEFSGSGDILGELSEAFDEGDHHRIFAVVLLGEAEAHWQSQGADFITALTIRSDDELPDCEDEYTPETPHIEIPTPSDGQYRIEIEDVYGHWSTVTDENHPDGIILTGQNGSVELIGSIGQDTNLEHYRLTKVGS